MLRLPSLSTVQETKKSYLGIVKLKIGSFSDFYFYFLMLGAFIGPNQNPQEVSQKRSGKEMQQQSHSQKYSKFYLYAAHHPTFHLLCDGFFT